MPPRESAAMPQQQDSSPVGVKSPLSCHQCRRLKRRCDRQYPCCQLCGLKERIRRQVRTSSHEASSLSSSNTSPQSSSADNNSQRELPSRRRKSNAHHQLSELNELNLLTASFLDPDAFILAQLATQKPDVVITKHVADLVGSVSDIQTTAQCFFESVHLWMPIVSKRQFHAHLLHRLAIGRVDLFLLVLAMKLLSTRETVAKSMLYRAVKQFYFDVESAGRLSVQSLQAAVLIAIYELGHGIYPAAIISVANCARIGTLLGIDTSVSGAGLLEGVPWIELEERRRVWWAIIILDRFMNLSYPKRSLVTLDPDPESYLPVDDEDWDNGVSQPDDAVPLRLSSQVHIGRFARFAHAVPLLSQAIYRSDEDRHNTAQLRRTILSLIHLGEAEEVEDRVLFCTLNAVSYLAVFVLDNPSINSTEPQPADKVASPETLSAIQHAIKLMMLEAARAKCDKLSPFVLHMMYKALTVCLRLRHANPAGLDVETSIQTLKHGLDCFRGRWLVAGTYLLLVKRQEVFSLVQTP